MNHFVAGETMERSSSRALQIRPARLTAAALTFITAALLLLVAAGAAHAAVWVIPTTGRAFPGTTPTAAQTTNPAISIDAAGNEYEGVQVAIRNGSPQDVTFTWSKDSDPLITSNTILDRVAYVNVARATTKVGSHAGEYPDPLLPKRFGDRLSVPANETTSFYLLTHVPYGTPGGDYHATLVANGGAEGTVAIPFTLHVWPFGWRQLSTRTGFSFNQRALDMSLRGAPRLPMEQPRRASPGALRGVPDAAAARHQLARRARRAQSHVIQQRALRRREVRGLDRPVPRRRTGSTCRRRASPGCAGGPARGARSRPPASVS